MYEIECSRNKITEKYSVMQVLSKLLLVEIITQLDAQLAPISFYLSTK